LVFACHHPILHRTPEPSQRDVIGWRRIVFNLSGAARRGSPR